MIVDILQYATSKVPFYYKYSTYNNTPIIGKNDIQNNYNKFISKDYIHKKLIKYYTSGSSGMPLCVFFSKEEIINCGVQLWRERMRHYKNLFNIPMIMFVCDVKKEKGKNPFDGMYISGNQIEISLLKINLNFIKRCVAVLSKIKKVWMSGQPSIIASVAKIFKENNIGLSNVEFVELVGEMLFYEQRKIISDYISCNIANLYGTTEFHAIAYECKFHNLHIMDKKVFVEIFDNGVEVGYNKEGEIIISDLVKKSMPLIRYNIGDIGILQKSKCKCGSKSDILILSGGRVSESVKLKNKVIIHPWIFAMAVRRINSLLGKIIITKFQIHQKEYDFFYVKLVLDNGELNEGLSRKYISNRISDEIINRLNYKVNIEYAFVDEIDIDSVSKKFKYFYPIKE